MALPIFPHLAKPVKLIVLDRDGVINEDSDEYVKSVEEWIPIPGSLEAIARLCKAGWTVAVATNQSGVARGKFDLSTLGDMHFKMQQLVMGQGGRIDLIVHCPHGPDDGCDCRKPKPGMLRQIAAHYATDLAGIWFVGDTGGDLQAALAVDGHPALLADAHAAHRRAALAADRGAAGAVTAEHQRGGDRGTGGHLQRAAVENQFRHARILRGSAAADRVPPPVARFRRAAGRPAGRRCPERW